MASTKGKTTKKVEKKQVNKRVTVSQKKENWRHIFAGFLLGLTTCALIFSAYLIFYAM